MKKISPYSSLLTVVGMMFLFVGCHANNQNKSLQRYINAVYAKPAVEIEAIPTVKAQAHFTYVADNLRSPFDPATKRLSKTDNSAPALDRMKEALEAFPVDSLAMVGLVTLGKSPWALITGPDSTIYRVTLGNYIGQDFGQIVNISKDAVTISETLPDGSGGWRKKTRLLSLNDEVNH